MTLIRTHYMFSYSHFIDTLNCILFFSQLEIINNNNSNNNDDDDDDDDNNNNNNNRDVKLSHDDENE